MMIYIVMGLPGVGKSTYIKENFNDVINLDILGFQQTYGVVNGYYEMIEALKNMITSKTRNGKDIVVEHTLFKEKRRKEQIEAIREVSNEEITLIFIDKPDDLITQQMLKRLSEDNYYFDLKTQETNVRKQIRENRMILEPPREDEGFYKILRVV